jgi:hypothetical protein
MDYGEVLTRAWRIIWKYKVLWLFGILAGCGNAAGNSGGSSNSGFRQQFNFDNPAGSSQLLNRIQTFFENIPVWVWVLLVLALLVLFVIMVILSTIGQIGLIHGTNEGDQDVERLSFGPLFSSSLKYFWRVFLLNFIVGLVFAIVIIAFIVGFAAVGIATLGVALVCLVPLLCILIPLLVVVGWVISVVLEQSVVAIVSEDRGMIAGVERGWEVVRSHIGSYVIMALILFVGAGVIGFLIALPMSLALVPIALGAFSASRGGSLVGVGVGALIFIVYLPILLLLTGVLRAYTTAAWTLTFRRLSQPAAIPPVPYEVIPPVEPIEPAGPAGM